MEQMINVMGRNYVLADNKISELIAWLEYNALKYTTPKSVVKEDVNHMTLKEQVMKMKTE